MPSGLVLDGKVPVFVFPNSLKFYLDDQTTHKRILTIYNPYEFPVRFKILCTNRDKYIVIDPDGSIKPHFCIDIVVRYVDVKPANCNVTDKFRIQLQDHATRQVIGKRDIISELMGGVPDDLNIQSERENAFESLPPISPELSRASHHYSIQHRTQDGVPINNGTNYIIILTGLICAIALLMPNEGETSVIPIHVSLNLKLVFSYILGLVTMVIFRA